MPARLHHERIARTGTTPARWLLLTHGIYGSGMNWRGIARKLNERRTDWGVVLVDLRQHGRSESGEPPHTIAACAEDVRALMHELGGISAIAGHSFGGKVVLATRPLVDVAQTWVLDSTPSPRPHLAAGNTVLEVLALMERLPKTWARREDFVDALTAEGHEVAFAQWLAMNVVPGTDGALTLRLDTAALREMLADYYIQDLWPSMSDPRGGAVEIVIADRSSTVSPADRERLAHAPSHIHVHHIDSDHWLHIEAPGPVVEMFATTLAT